MKRLILFSTLSAFVFVNAFAQLPDTVCNAIKQIILSKRAVTGVCITGSNAKDTFTFNAERHYPLQSVFKFHIALVVLSLADKGKLNINQKITIAKKDLLPGLYSPIRDKYPNGARLTIAEIMGYTVSASDNVGCDILLKLIGGPRVVEQYFTRHGFGELSVKYNEETQQNKMGFAI